MVSENLSIKMVIIRKKTKLCATCVQKRKKNKQERKKKSVINTYTLFDYSLTHTSYLRNVKDFDWILER